MKCKILNNDLISYAEGSLSAERKDHIDSHLTHCSDCNEFVSFLRQSLLAIEKDKEVAVNTFMYTRVVTRLDADERHSYINAKKIIPAFAFSFLLLLGIIGGINLGKLYSDSIPGYSIELQEEISYIDDIKQEPIEVFFSTSNEAEDE